MSEVSEAELKRRKHILDSLAAKNKANGATEDEMFSATTKMSELMQLWAMEDYDPEQKEAKYTVVRRMLKVKYANKWRWDVANSIAWNVGILALHFKANAFRKEFIQYNGREVTVEAAATLAEWVIAQIEELSSKYAREVGGGTTEKRRFARGCALRVRVRIKEATDLTADVRLPMVLEAQRDEIAKLVNYNGKQKRKRSVDEKSIDFYLGWTKGDIIQIRKREAQIVG